MFGTSYITVMHPDDWGQKEILAVLPSARLVKTFGFGPDGMGFDRDYAVSLFKAPAATAEDQAHEAALFVTNVFTSKTAAIRYIQEKNEFG